MGKVKDNIAIIGKIYIKQIKNCNSEKSKNR